MAGTELSLEIRPDLSALPEDESLATEDRRAETFLLYSTGWRQASIARRFGVSQATTSKDLKIEFARRHERSKNIEDELERVCGVVENVMSKAWERHNSAFEEKPHSVAASNYLKLVLEAAEKLAHLRGLDAPRAPGNATHGPTRVIVQIGGNGAPQIAVGVES